MSFEKVIRPFIEEALEYNKDNKSCHVAILLQGKHKVISHGFNQMDRQCFRGKSIRSLHAEIDCIRKCRPLKDLLKRNYNLVILKVAKDVNRTFYDSRPCKHCTIFLQGLGFKNVYCSDNNGEIVKINLDEYIPYNLYYHTEYDTEKKT
jgi:deoxycytidylate deaminase